MSNQAFMNQSSLKPWEVGLLDRKMPWMDISKLLLEKGVTEVPGSQHNPEIVNFFDEVGHNWVKDDETPWCAAFVGAVLQRSGYKSTRKLNARSYLEYGHKLDAPAYGCLVVFWRKSKDSSYGHVGFFAGYSETLGKIWILGGNQKDSVSLQEYAIDRVLGYRWPEAEFEDETSFQAPPHLAAHPVDQVPQLDQVGRSAELVVEPLYTPTRLNFIDRFFGLGSEKLAKLLKGKKSLIGLVSFVATTPAIVQAGVNLGVPQEFFTDVLPAIASLFGGGGVLSKLSSIQGRFKL